MSKEKENFNSTPLSFSPKDRLHHMHLHSVVAASMKQRVVQLALRDVEVRSGVVFGATQLPASSDLRINIKLEETLTQSKKSSQ